MPFFEVKVLAQVVMLVEADDEGKANELAFDEVDLQKSQHKEVQCTRQLLEAEDIDRARRHCDQVLTA